MDAEGISAKTDLSMADLSDTLLIGADLSGADLSEANLSEAKLSGANFNRADLSEANPEVAQSLTKTDLCGVKVLRKEQLATCKGLISRKTKDAIIDEDPSTSSTLSSVPPPPPS
jgi:hypothetical protein